jgi:hypothetical protein
MVRVRTKRSWPRGTSAESADETLSGCTVFRPSSEVDTPEYEVGLPITRLTAVFRCTAQSPLQGNTYILHVAQYKYVLLGMSLCAYENILTLSMFPQYQSSQVGITPFIFPIPYCTQQSNVSNCASILLLPHIKSLLSFFFNKAHCSSTTLQISMKTVHVFYK